MNGGFVTGFAELKKQESGWLIFNILSEDVRTPNTLITDRLLDFSNYHIHSADDHYVRWKWQVGSVAMWDNRYFTPTTITTI